MLFLHISREKILLEGEGFSEFLVYENIERTLPVKLFELIQKYHISRIWVLNGPGGFTFLRLGCLVVNMLKALGDISLEIYECSKFDIYTYAQAKGLLPDVGVVFMGQRKKMRKVEGRFLKIISEDVRRGKDEGRFLKIISEDVRRGKDEGRFLKMNSEDIRRGTHQGLEKLKDNDTGSIEILTLENIEEFVGCDEVYFIDPCEHVLLDYLDKENMVEMSFSGEKLRLSWKGESLDVGVEDLGLVPMESLAPRYMMDLY